jgi:NAD(P)-dependent dehydrogenase (short-subunit alcohol dehydrogenase family)
MNTIVMTGGTSGLGEVAARRFIETPNTRLLLGARRRGPLGRGNAPARPDAPGRRAILRFGGRQGTRARSNQFPRAKCRPAISK